jgi:hypothetical protein
VDGQRDGLLAERGYPVPALLWRGALDARWFVVVQARLPGQPLHTLDAPGLDRLLALVELQADQAPRLGEGGWDLSWWAGVVLFQGWEHWWDSAQAATPQTSRRLRAFLQPAWGHRLPGGDLVHGDLNLTNVLATDGVISGVVDWDDLGLAAAPSTLPGCCWTGTASTWQARRSWRRTARNGWSTGSSRSPENRGCAASSPTVRSHGSAWPPSARRQTPCRPGAKSPGRCWTPCNEQGVPGRPGPDVGIPG